jgi:hypothetical protein
VKLVFYRKVATEKLQLPELTNIKYLDCQNLQLPKNLQLRQKNAIAKIAFATFTLE